MLSKENNDLLTLVEGNAPMGRFLRDLHWIPFLRAGKLKPDGPPERVRLLGENFVAFRGSDGSVGFLDEACPHRGASLALARNENCALECIFHGWKINTAGQVISVPNESKSPETFAKKVPVRHYAVREAGGLLWVWLGEGSEPLQFPEFDFTGLPDDHLFVSYTPLDCNWMQGLDAAVDSSHVSILHQSWVPQILGAPPGLLQSNSAPRYEVEETDYGMRAAALRDLPDGSCYARVGEFVLPFFMFIGTSNSAAGEATLFTCVPVDDTHSFLIFLRYARAGRGPLTTGPGKPDYEQGDDDLDNFAPVPGDAWKRWGQDRAAMQDGHYTGYTSKLLLEDIVVQTSMGPIVDRTKEHLTSADLGTVRMRRLLLKAIRDHQAGADVSARIEYGQIRADAFVVPPGKTWRDNVPAQLVETMGRA